MNDKQIPLHIEGIRDSLYAGFLPRLASLLLDAIFILPFVFIIQYLNGLGRDIYFYTIIPNLLFALWYHVYLPKRNGGTPGKLIAGITIVKMNGDPIGWEEAFKRHIITLFISLLTVLVMTIVLMEADNETYKNLGWLKRAQYLKSLEPGLFSANTWVSNIWFWGELIVLLTNERKRAIHDYVAETVVVRTLYLDKIRAVMAENNNTTHQ